MMYYICITSDKRFQDNEVFKSGEQIKYWFF